ncbi:MAG: pullulanase-type alpha-1,6-glucosidase [Ilumatobacter sp.]|uniref:pullulanase-type alpha-1,6-glucosidase n=1 Tax=Ilumatobacter sp. TaxID=1967498 RepID=UPI0026397AD7|nr:pullulanase-type alpha-1,6-glucosidase [Ilumatobacter sp.]MDJ0771144.1 pullulanase-type alpha-1,6-glucosidase [Ilumatobacter sp.]
MITAIAPAAVADHTADPGTVTVAGSLQDELGCPGDWQPDCADTHLVFDAEDGVYQGTFTLPAGSYEYKAAINDSWDENYGANAQPGGANIPLDLAAPTDVKFYFDPDTKWVTDDVNSTIATAAGSFQSELGCSGDWQPWCLQSWLQDIDGDGVYTFSTDQIPAGTYEFKVALDEDWATSFPAGNVPMTVPAGATVTFTYDTADDSVSFDPGGGTAEPGDELLVRPPVREAAAEDVFYFVMPDRFANGDPSNDSGGDLSGDPLVNGYDPTHKGFYHGGDLAGLTGQLPYLDSLGVDAIWVTPPFTNRWVGGAPGGISAGYHGYWQIDYSSIDPHFGTNAEMVAFVDAAHALGIDVYFDIVANHTGDVITYEEGDEPPYISKADQPYLDATGAPFDDSDYAGTGTFPPVDPAITFPYTPTFDSVADETVKFPDFLDDPSNYHNRGNSTFSGENSLYGDFFGLDDLWTEKPEVQDGLIQVFKDMVSDFDIDGFRIDTVKHVNDEFWEAFGPELNAHASSLGKDDFFMFGEVFDFDVQFLSRFSTELPLDATLDFAFQGTARNFASQSGPTDNVAGLYAADDYYTDADSNAYSQTLFLGNHDIGRFGLFVNQDNPGATDAELLARDQLAHALMYFGRGAPVVYYGDEQGFVGDGGDQDARQDMFPSQVATYNDDDNIGTAASPADDNFDTGHPLYTTLAEYGGLLEAHPALTRGAQLQRYSEGSAGILAFSRIERTEKVEYVVALNNSEAADSATFGTDSPNTSFTEIYPGGGPAVTADGAGNLSVDVPALGVKVYRADAGITVPTIAPVVTMNAPAADSEVLGRVEVGADLSLAGYTEVTFAVSTDGGTTYEPIGTDDNAPYRMFHDVSGLAPGTPLMYKAIADNMSGAISSAKVAAVVGEEEPPAFGGFDYAVIHYNRPAGDYGDHTAGPDYWGLHLWGDGIDPSEETTWPVGKPFEGEDEFGRFAWIQRGDGSQVNFIVQNQGVKDTDPDRGFNADETPEVWINQGDETIYLSQADAQGYATIRYHRDDGDYGTPSPDFNTFWGLHLWGDAIDPSEGTDWTSPKPPDGIDDFGAFWNVLLQDSTQPLNFIIHRGDEKDPGPDESFIPFDIPTVWKISGDEEIYPSRGAAEDVAVIHYHRPDGDYGDNTSPDFNDFWGLHVWEGSVSPTDWPDPVRWVDVDVFGPRFEVPVQDGAPQLAYIIHRGDDKDPGPDQFLTFDPWGYEVWQLSGENPSDPETPHYVLPILGAGVAPGDIGEQRAHWVAEDTIVWTSATDPGVDYALCHAPTGGMTLGGAGIEGGTCLDLTPGAPFDPDDFDHIDGTFLHLSGQPTLKIGSGDLGDVPSILTGQIAVQATDAGLRLDATGIQIPGVLDDLYATDTDLGVTWDGDAPTIALWAPTAKTVTLHVFADADPATTSTTFPMTWDAATGTWTAIGGSSWNGAYYLYEIEVYVPSTGAVETNFVTDPYSVSLSMNSTRTHIVDLTDPALAPDGWDDVEKPDLERPEDISIYELHVRDFSIADETVDEELRGTFAAFGADGSNGMEHLEGLADAGLSHIHLLPSFDIATINENAAERVEPDPAVLATYPPDSEEQQAAVEAVKDLDGFNWGYDPFHYTAPEGSYSTDPDGSQRIVEFREMVQSLNETGLRVVMDVVYNHTNASGQAEKSVLDRIVPGYYHRLNDVGAVETSTCCANTATEHAMMGRLMIDSLVTWAKEHKVDGFRFDLMGHHSKQNMLDVRAALDELTLADDGVDGSSIYLYGEGWNFGEVANNARFVQATQLEMAGTGIGTFSDRLRDAVRGGGPFDDGQSLLDNQGFINGLWYDSNGGLSEANALNELLLSADQIRVGLAGNLADYEFVDSNGDLVTGKDIDYNGSPAGYTADPQENIVYIAAHDNQTLFDIGQYHHPVDTTMDERVRAQNVGNAITALAQGVPFFHAGQDMLRSKSLDRDSFNSGDWFNKLDFTYQSNNFGVGLPVAEKNQSNWPIQGPLLANPDLVPEPDDIEFNVAVTREWLEVRESSELFRLETADEIQARLSFGNTGTGQTPGLIAMSIRDDVDGFEDLDDDYEGMLLLVNATDEAVSYTDPSFIGAPLELHPVLAGSVDPIVGTSTYDDATGEFTVPARTAVVFVDLGPDETPPEVEAELDRIWSTRRIGLFHVGVECSDDRGETTVVADVNGVPVDDGDLVFLIKHRWRDGSISLPFITFIWGRDFVLTATCTDEAGNTATATDVAEFRRPRPWWWWRW